LFIRFITFQNDSVFTVAKHLHKSLKISTLCVNVHISPVKKQAAIPLQAWSGPEGPRKLRFPDFMKTAQDGGKVVRFMHWLPLPPGNTPGTHFC